MTTKVLPFTGDAKKYLHKHFQIAREMQRIQNETADSAQNFSKASGGPDAGLSEPESPAGDATARTAGRVDRGQGS